MVRLALPALVLATVTLMGCASVPEQRWWHDYKSSQHFATDAAECELTAYQSTMGNVSAGDPVVQQRTPRPRLQEAYELCMHSRGWRGGEVMQSWRRASAPDALGPR